MHQPRQTILVHDGWRFYIGTCQENKLNGDTGAARVTGLIGRCARPLLGVHHPSRDQPGNTMANVAFWNVRTLGDHGVRFSWQAAFL